MEIGAYSAGRLSGERWAVHLYVAGGRAAGRLLRSRIGRPRLRLVDEHVTRQSRPETTSSHVHDQSPRPTSMYAVRLCRAENPPFKDQPGTWKRARQIF